MEVDLIDVSVDDLELVLILWVLDLIGVVKWEFCFVWIFVDKLLVMVCKMVYQEVMKELEVEMVDWEIDVEM